jgi:thermitase
VKFLLLLLCVAIVLTSLLVFQGVIDDIVSTVCMAEGDETVDDTASAEVALPSDPGFDKQWAFVTVNLRQAWLVTQGSDDVLVAILDTGIDRNHEDLAGKVIAEVNLSHSRAVDDLYGHGTHIAGIIAAGADNGIGICGVAPGCSLMNIKVADDRGKCGAGEVADGIVWAVDAGARVLNISLCLTGPSGELEDAIDYAWNHGAVIVAAAGNGGGTTPQYPAYYEQCIAVTGAREDGSRAPLANYGDWVDVAAPGYQIYSTLPDDDYGYKTGTSQAAAYVSGVAALLYSIAVDSNGDGKVNDEVRAAIETSCQQLERSGMGHGLVDGERAVEQLKDQ